MTFKERVEMARERQVATWIEDCVAVIFGVLTVGFLFIFMLLLCG